MLDTNMCIYVLKQRSLSLMQKFQQAEVLYISTVVYAELCYGIELSPTHLQKPRWEQLQMFVQPIVIHGWDKQAAEHYAKLHAYLKQRGTPIGNMDMLIAAHALRFDATLVSNNIREFERVPNLKLENWVDC
ncbi:type II toxin-antitoxin system VapC family toxin [Candidatus Albibeggiatoa sp. nov. NOAA]|uniref:type II toxin-antitoxin system VapC family toxin n=1 Tax=Candidatus Albibeggiatoa sp. nov. NOAA TaxID=3162724 RepID=UPI003303C715|nr:type II toxin-antitoxin system VapC family toxin [Thiotrichaceae bacterium]